MRLKLALALSLMAAPPASDLQVTLKEGRVVLRATRAPLVEVLSRLATATGTKVVYETARPRQPVTLVIEAATVAEAITRLLEGQGLNYVLRLDPGGRNVEMLLILGTSGAPAAATATRQPRPGFTPSRPPEEEPPAEELAPDEAEPPPDEAAEPFPPPGPEAPGGSPGPQPTEPQPPGPASYPETAPPPTQPTYPGPASYPPPGD